MHHAGIQTAARMVRGIVAVAVLVVGLWLFYLLFDPASAQQELETTLSKPAVAVALFNGGTSPEATEKPLAYFLSGSAHMRAAADNDGEKDTPLQSIPEPVIIEDDGYEEPITSPPEKTDVITHTSVGKAGGGFIAVDDFYIKNTTKADLDVAALATANVVLESKHDGPQILILHTHATEAYTMTDTNAYKPSDPYRTIDCTQNIVQVGRVMAQEFRDAGFEVIHDETLHDYPVYTDAYSRSGETAKKWLSQYPSIRLILDVHRDALATEDGTPYRLISQVDGADVAQLMLVVGSDYNGAVHPNWRENLSFAVQVQKELTADYGILARPITLRTSRYNQHLGVGSLLVEVGGHGNTLEEAIQAAKLFVKSIVKLI